MPLSENEQVNRLANNLLVAFRDAFHTPDSERPAHARGQFVKGTFTPSDAGASLSTAPIFSTPSTPIVARFSSSTGIPGIPDNDSSADPRGLAIRWILSADGHTHYDAILHSANGFVVRTGEDLLTFFEANKNGTTADFFAKHPESAKFPPKVTQFPKSFATEQFFGVSAFKFTNAEGKETYFRYRVVPADVEVAHYSQQEMGAKGKDYLYDELKSRLQLSAGSFKFKLLAQIARPGDVLDDSTESWPEDRELVDLGIISINEIWRTDGEGSRDQKRLIFDPMPRQIDGIDPSADPLIDLRAATYLLSGKKRREAAGVA